MQRVVQQAYEYAKPHLGKGALAEYIPELKNADPHKLAVAITLPDGTQHSYGDVEHRFTIQSISKIILLAVALQDVGFDTVFSKVGMEPTGDPFNSIVRLETMDKNKPLNPMINAGAISVVSCIQGANKEEKFAKILAFSQELLHNPTLDYDEKTFQSELANGDRNRALAYMMRSTGIIQGDVEDYLDVYFKACSIFATCPEVSVMGATLANNGVAPFTRKQLLSPAYIHTIRALMCTCGMYDASGEFAVKVGVPAKSGVGGGIMAAVPNRMGICTFSPALSGKGNSLCGLLALQSLSEQLNLSIF